VIFVDAATLLARHAARGRQLVVNGVVTFVREEGHGQPVVCVHGVPVSSWTWRGVLAALAERGMRGIAPDLPGTGLSARPDRFDYSWTGLGRHLAATLQGLRLPPFHLVVHDIGGPIGFEAVALMPGRVRSITLLDTIVEPHTFHRPWPMAPFAVPGIGELWLNATPRPVFRALMRRVGYVRGSTVTRQEIDVHYDLLHREDDGRAFLHIMRSFERSRAKSELYADVLAPGQRPVQLVWGVDDKALPVSPYGETAARVIGADRPLLMKARHFLMEDYPSSIADIVASLAAES